jgi:hypothetical protein
MLQQRTFSASVLLVALVTGILLMVPFLAMKFTAEVNWSVFDFILGGTVIFTTGLAFVVLMKYASNLVSRAAMVMALGTTFLMVWVDLAVGIIGSGPNLANLLYGLVVAGGVIGAILSQFAPRGMERTMYAMAAGVVVIAFIALLSNMQAYSGSSVLEIIAVNSFFAVLFGIAGVLFRYVGMVQSQKSERSEG